jgi:3-hydroxyisobutyrate dehydrogenase-like beta-hydroxyacid dehydrogenase
MATENAIVGIVGLGIMGSAIARNMVARGFPVRGFDIDPACNAVLGESGGVACPSASEVAAGTRLLLTSLPSAAALDATVESVVAAHPRGLVVAELSTLPIDVKERARARLAEADITLLDCPLSGTGAQALTGDLAVYASGERAAYDRAEPVFLAFARVSHYLGAFGNGSRMKFVANLLVAIHNVASAEAMVLGIKAGLEPATIVKVIASGAGNSRVFELRAPLMAASAYQPATMKIDIWQKDMAIIADFARGLGVATPTFSATEAIYDAAQREGLGAEDTAAVCAVLEKQSSAARSRS